MKSTLKDEYIVTSVTSEENFIAWGNCFYIVTSEENFIAWGNCFSRLHNIYIDSMNDEKRWEYLQIQQWMI